MTRLTIRLFGYPQILVDHKPIQVERRKTLALVAYLAIEANPTGGAISGTKNGSQPECGRDQLATLLWPTCSQEQATAYLRQALWDFNKSAGEGWISKSGQALSLNPGAEIWVDAQVFEALLAEWKSGAREEATSISILEEMVALYRDDFLAGFTLRDSSAFDNWQGLQTELHRLYLTQALEALARLHAERQEFQIATTHLRRWLELDPVNEAAHRLLMRLYEDAGQRGAALHQYEVCQKLVEEELGLALEAETVALYERIRAGELAPAAPEAAVPAERPSTSPKAPQRLPTGTVTFLFTDIEGSTQLWENHPAAMKHAFSRQEVIVRAAVEGHSGYIYKMVGDAFQVAFSTAPAALAAALDAQRALHAEPWGQIGALKVRMALHTGVTEERGDDYVGPALNRVARLMNAGHGGQVLLSQSTYDLIQEDLPQDVTLLDLGEKHLKDLHQPEHVYQVIAAGLPEEFPPLRMVDVPLISLPQQHTLFVGREAELAKIDEMLSHPECRLISLVGIGGSGKTRLAIQAAGKSRAFQEGVYFVPLADISSLDGMILAIAEAIKVRFQDPTGSRLSLEAAQAQLLRYLAEKRILLVLDNFEQLTCCAGFIADLLASAPGVKLIVTSRERLRLPGEWVLEVAGLDFPGSQEKETIQDYAAVQLFVKGAERAGCMTLDALDWRAIARICQLVEGIPLGVEMAAAWTRMLSCQEIAAEIERDLDFLTASWRGMPERHRTLRLVFEHSWRLLSEDERQVFRRLSVFRGAFSRAAALEIAGATLPLLATLADKSFVRRVSSGNYEIHPVLRRYALEKLAADPVENAEARFQHARYYTDWLCQMNEELKGRQQLAALSSLRSELQNLRDSWEWLVQKRDFERMRRSLPGIVLYYVMDDQHLEMQEIIPLLLEMAEALRSDSGAPPATSAPQSPSFTGLLALTLAATRFFRYDPEHQERSNPFQVESLHLIQGLPDSMEKAHALLLCCTGGGILTPEQAIKLGQECVDLFQRLGDPWGATLAQMLVGDAATFGGQNPELARTSYRASLEAFTRLGNLWGQGMCLTGLFTVEYNAGNLEEAYRLGRQSLEIYEQLGNFERLLFVRNLLGEIAEKWGETAEARRYFQANLDHYIHRGNERAQKYCRDRLAALEQKTRPLRG